MKIIVCELSYCSLDVKWRKHNSQAPRHKRDNSQIIALADDLGGEMYMSVLRC